MIIPTGIQQEFLTICRQGSVPDIRTFHDKHILPRFRSDSAFPYYRLMGEVYLAIRQVDPVNPVTEWFWDTAAKNQPLK